MKRAAYIIEMIMVCAAMASQAAADETALRQKKATDVSARFIANNPACQAAYKTGSPWIYVDFDESMKTKLYPDIVLVTKYVLGIDGKELLGFFRNLYEQFNLSVVEPFLQPRIPKIIHQIWLGGSVPEAFKKYMESWVLLHFGRQWKYKLWTDEDIEPFGLYNKSFYDQSDNYGVKSDILKWEIVYRHGGVYIDTDFECLKPLDILHYTYDFYTGIQPLASGFIQLGAALFGAVPGHPILRHCIETIKDDWHHKGAPTKTGPVHFTKSFYATAGREGRRDIALPVGYLYAKIGRDECKGDRQEWLAHEGAYAIHHWAMSWMPKSYRSPEFRELGNDASTKSWND